MSAIDGLISGMNTSSIIAQLMQLERQPVVRLEGKKATADRAITALQSLNTKFLAIADLAGKLSKAAGWSPLKAESSHPDLAGVSAAAGTSPTSLSFKVVSLSAAHQIFSAATFSSPTEQVAQAGRTITISYTGADGAPATLDFANHDGTLAGIAEAVNGLTDAPVTARVLKTTDAGDYQLVLTAKQSGAASAFTVSGIRNPPTQEMAFSVATQASDAEIHLGSSGTPLSIKSASNTLVDVVPGVTLTLKKADPSTTVTVDISRDTAAISSDVEKLIEAANAFLADAKTLTAFDPASKKAGLLQGNRTVRDLAGAVLQAVSTAVGDRSAASVGIELTKDGALKFDKAKFEAAYTADPAAAAAMFAGAEGVVGLAQRFGEIAERATKSTTGLLTQAIDSRRREIQRIDVTIASWDVRLSRRAAALRRQFTALETALGAAQQQGNWLASQLAGLPKSSE